MLLFLIFVFSTIQMLFLLVFSNIFYAFLCKSSWQFVLMQDQRGRNLKHGKKKIHKMWPKTNILWITKQMQQKSQIDERYSNK